MISSSSNQLRHDRRCFLRRAGLALALPLLESAPLRCEESGKRVSRPIVEPPVRFACVYFSNGVEPEHWWARGKGAGMEIGPGLRPMRPHLNDMIFLKGLFNEQAVRHDSAHLGRMPNMLSGAWVSTDQNEIRVGKTMDQVLSQRIGHRTAIPSLVLGVEPTELRLEDGLSMIYGSCISWADDTRPSTKEIYPSRVFDLLAGDGRDRQLDQSVLDDVTSDARRLRGQLGKTDRNKLDEYLESIRSIERRIERASKEDRLEGWRPTLVHPNMARPGERLPQEVPDHMRLMMDLIVYAEQRPVSNELWLP